MIKLEALYVPDNKWVEFTLKDIARLKPEAFDDETVWSGWRVKE